MSGNILIGQPPFGDWVRPLKSIPGTILDRLDNYQVIRELIRKRAVKVVLPTTYRQMKYLIDHGLTAMPGVVVLCPRTRYEIDVLDHKGCFIRHMRTLGLAQYTPVTYGLSEVQGGRAAWPLILKPCIGLGGDQIQIYNTPAEFEARTPNRSLYVCNGASVCHYGSTFFVRAGRIMSSRYHSEGEEGEVVVLAPPAQIVEDVFQHIFRILFYSGFVTTTFKCGEDGADFKILSMCAGTSLPTDVILDMVLTSPQSASTQNTLIGAVTDFSQQPDLAHYLQSLDVRVVIPCTVAQATNLIVQRPKGGWQALHIQVVGPKTLLIMNTFECPVSFRSFMWQNQLGEHYCENLLQRAVIGQTEYVGNFLVQAGVIKAVLYYREDTHSPLYIKHGRMSRPQCVEAHAMEASTEVFRQIFESLEFTGLACADFKLDEDGELQIFEINPRLGGTLANRPDDLVALISHTDTTHIDSDRLYD